MHKHIFIFLIFVFATLVSCQKSKKKFTTSQFDPSSKNFAFLKEAIKDVKVLAIGESSHGFGSMHAMKANLVQYLHKELGYNLLIMEAGYADVGLAWYNLDVTEPMYLINGTMPSYMRTEELFPLFEYLKENRSSKKPLELRGMDSRISGMAFNFRLMYVIKRLEPRVIQDSIENGLLDYYKTLDALDNQVEWQKYMDSYRSSIDFAKSILQDSKEDIKELELAKDEEVAILLRYLDILKDEVNYKFGETYKKGPGLRDSLMAENVSYFIEKEFPKTKVIIWGHNGHIEKGSAEGDNIKWLGHYLKERYGDKYYALGMYSKKGFIYQNNNKKTSSFDINDLSFVEAKMYADYGKNVFVDLPQFDESVTSWFHQPINGYELEAGGQVRFIPSQRFDGMLLLGETKGPNFLINTRNKRK